MATPQGLGIAGACPVSGTKGQGAQVFPRHCGHGGMQLASETVPRQEERRRETPCLVSPPASMTSASASPSGCTHPDTSHQGSLGQMDSMRHPLQTQRQGDTEPGRALREEAARMVSLLSTAEP